MRDFSRNTPTVGQNDKSKKPNSFIINDFGFMGEIGGGLKSN